MLLEVILIVVLPTLFVSVGAIVLGRRRTVSAGDFDADSVSFVGGVLSALFTVVLAFYIVFAWQLGADVESAASSESDALIDAYWQADILAEPERSRLHGLLRDYAGTVADSEWALLDQGRVDPAVARIIGALRDGFGELPTESGAVQVARELALRDVRQIDESHRARVGLTTGGSTFNDILLGGTIIGGALMIAFPLLAGLSATPANVAVMAMLTVTIGATVFLSLQLTHPLHGLFGTDPDAFVDALSEMAPQAP